MLAHESIVKEVPTIHPAETGDTAMRWMDEYKLSHLCVVDGKKFLGTVSEDAILDMTDIGKPIESIRDQLNISFVRKDQHIFEALKLINDHRLSLVPVLENNGPYLGCISINQIIEDVAGLPMINGPGAIIVLELNTIDYSLQSISGIVEENNALILGSYIQGDSDSNSLYLTLKLNIVDSSAVISSLQRHDFKVLYHESEQQDSDDIQDRYDALMNFLNV